MLVPVTGFPPSFVGGVQDMLAKFGPNSLTLGCPGASGVSEIKTSRWIRIQNQHYLYEL